MRRPEKTEKTPIQQDKSLPSKKAKVVPVRQTHSTRRTEKEALRRSLEYWQNTFDAINDAICLLDSERKILQCNRGMSELTSKSASQITGRRPCEFIHGKPQHLQGCPWLRMLKTHRRETQQLQVEDKRLLITVDPILDADRQFIAAVHIVSDITERKRTEEKLARLNKVQRVIANVNQDIFLIKDRRKLLERICKRIVEYAYKLVWIGFCDEKTKQVVPAAQAGFEKGYLDFVKITYDNTEYGKGPTGTAIRTKKPAVMRFIATDPKYEPWREKALKRGYHSSAAIPIFGADKVIGALNVYSDREDAFSDEEVKLLEELAHDIAIGLRAIDEEARRERAEDAQWESEERFKRALENIPDVVVIYDADLRIQYINAATRQITGRPTSDFIGKREEEIWPPEVYQVYLPTLREAFNTRTICSLETNLSLPDSGLHSLKITCVPLTDEKGNIREVMGITHDFTERKRAEEKIQSYQKQLTLTSQLAFAEERERRKIAAGLHDNVSQELALVKLEIQSSMKSISDAETLASLNSICGKTDNVIEDIRSLTFELPNGGPAPT